MTEPTRESSSRMSAGPGFGQADEHNPYWNFSVVRKESARSWGSISAGIVSRAAGTVVWRSDYHRVAYALTDVLGTIRNDEGPVQDWPLERDNFGFRPSGTTMHSTVEAPVRNVQILQSPDIYEQLVSDMVRGGTIGLEPRNGLHDPLVSQIALTIANEMEGGFLDRILADALNTTLAARIVRQYVDPSAITLAPLNGLSRERLKRVQDYIEAHLDDQLTLTEIAGVACLSSYHFSRSFKQATGVGPQRYVMLRRLERAKTLMRRTNHPLAMIAQEAGFTDQSHLTATFRRETGTTPGRYRAALA
jgi:AraC-like DNA-binding protein